MMDPRDTRAAFDGIAAQIEPLLVRLGRAAPGAELEIVRDEITALLDQAALRWSDLAARVAAPSPKVEPVPAWRPPPPPPEHRPAPEGPDLLDASTVLSNENLARYGFRSSDAGYGYEEPGQSGSDTPKSTG